MHGFSDSDRQAVEDMWVYSFTLYADSLYEKNRKNRTSRHSWLSNKIDDKRIENWEGCWMIMNMQANNFLLFSLQFNLEINKYSVLYHK